MTKDGVFWNTNWVCESLKNVEKGGQRGQTIAKHTASESGLTTRKELACPGRKGVWGGGWCISLRGGQQPIQSVLVAGLAGIASTLPGAHPFLCLTRPGGGLPVKEFGNTCSSSPCWLPGSLLGTGDAKMNEFRGGIAQWLRSWVLEPHGVDSSRSSDLGHIIWPLYDSVSSSEKWEYLTRHTSSGVCEH